MKKTSALDPFSIYIKEFRGLKDTEWSPEADTSLLIGDNGSGKTRFLMLLGLIGVLFRAGFPGLRGVGQLRNERFALTISYRGFRWCIDYRVDEKGCLQNGSTEALIYDMEDLVYAIRKNGEWQATCKGEFPPDGSVVSFYARKIVTVTCSPLVSYFSNLRLYRFNAMQPILHGKANSLEDVYLNHSGKNLWDVLQNWQKSEKHRKKYIRCTSLLRQIFPRIAPEFEWKDETWTYFYSYGSKVSLPVSKCPVVVISVLLILVALEGSKGQSLVLIDDFMNGGVHPHAVRTLLKYAEDTREMRRFRLILASHNREVMDFYLEKKGSVSLSGQMNGKNPIHLEECQKTQNVLRKNRKFPVAETLYESLVSYY